MGETTVVGPDQMPDWFERYAKFMTEVGNQLARGAKEPGKGLTLDQLQALVEHRNPFEMKEPKAPVESKAVLPIESDPILARWQANYRRIGIEPNFEGITLSLGPSEFGRIIVVSKGVTMNQVYTGLKKLFRCWRSHDDLDAAIPKNERTSAKAYAIAVRNRQEADDELANLSANDIETQNLATETVLERMLHELDYFLETGKHLDVTNVTLCAGSRSAVGRVPGAHWDGGRFQVRAGWSRPSYSLGDLRARAAVSV